MEVRHRISCSSSKEKTSGYDATDALYVIIFAQDAVEKTVEWLIDLLEKRQHDGGAELRVHTSVTEDEEVVILIHAEDERLLEAAEMMEITKEDKYGNMREFVLSDIDMFLKPGIDVHNLLSTSEKQRIILNEIMTLHSSLKNELVGYYHIKLYPGQSIVQVCKDHGIIKQIFPLHEPCELALLEKKWYTFPFLPQPLGEIRSYFGESVAFYFAFLGFYTFALIPPAFIGLLQAVITLDMTCLYLCFSVFKMIWLTLFLECWKRRSNELAFVWGTLKAVTLPQIHPTFRGKKMEEDPVTKQYVPVYPGYKRHLKVYFVSTPVVVLCLLFAVVVMLVYFKVEELVMDAYHEDDSIHGWILVQVPGVIYALLVPVMSYVFRKFADFLTEWENHKTKTSFENHRVMKNIAFEFVNNFLAMGYIAFYLQDMEMLKWQIGLMMVVNQLINQFQEAFLPVAIEKGLCFFKKSKRKMGEVSPQLKAVHKESRMWPYEDTYDDYLEMFIQFGYVFLFTSVYPLSAVFALINNVLEVWADGFKLCRVYQRPQAQPAKGIGVWQVAFETLGILSVMTNSALICLQPAVQSYIDETSSSCAWVLIAVLFEHVIIAVKILLSYLIPDIPKWVTVQIQKARYESLQAVKRERLASRKKKVL